MQQYKIIVKAIRQDGTERTVKLSTAQQKVIEQVCRMNPEQQIQIVEPDYRFKEAVNSFFKNSDKRYDDNNERYKHSVTRQNPGGDV